MAKKSSKPSKARKPLTISIHGEDVDIDAKIRDTKDVNAVLLALASKIQSAAPLPAPDSESTAHDFDIVMRVIKHGEVPVLESIVTLAQTEIDARKTMAANVS